MGKGKRAALCLRVSTDGQTVENQRRVPEAVAERRGWPIAATYEDAGISGAKGRDSRPGLEAAGAAIYADKEAVDATTPHGWGMLQLAPCSASWNARRSGA